MFLLSFPLSPARNFFPCITLSTYPSHGLLCAQKMRLLVSCSCHNIQDNGEQAKGSLHFEDKMKRRLLLTFLVGSGISPALPSSGKTKKQSPYDEKRLLEQNKRIQRENNAPDEFPNFVREGLILRDIEVGKGDCPKAGQQVTFHYVGYNESGRRIDSTYLQGSPAKVRLGTNALIPGFEEGIKDMKPGGKRRIIIPPELGPPVGPSTFFSSKQFEVFDIELVSIQDCTRRTIGFYSDVVCS
ncbi:peptidyl-prolyl cis-trans isomerase FKBP20-2, chloroplastic isoform X2 [Sesamum indicum]|uniref:peptidylprolyl isomerase n=1 Tax=Sesamum indicum TaxID=4182 RepID=A0A6I9TSS9_SESIN|nr:peptidyl-prolyl cis-trans isomerase FKBP20-2, chloroplastic isoform X2 [Sesamum indicum]